MVRVRLEIRMLLDGMQYNEYLAWGESVADDPPGTQTESLIEDYLSQFPLMVFVDGEEYHGVDRHSFDTHTLKVTIDPCIVTGDQLEALADVEDMKAAVLEIFSEGRDWHLSLVRF